jgi:holo-[acyl-carrier protein] synthase
MITGIGVDIVEMERIEDLTGRNPSWTRRILTPAEQEAFQTIRSKHAAKKGVQGQDREQTTRRCIEYLSGTFAAKEAFSKALGCGIGASCSFQDLSVIRNDNGAPAIVWHRAPEDFQGHIHLSISHSRDFAVAQVVIEEHSTFGE